MPKMTRVDIDNVTPEVIVDQISTIEKTIAETLTLPRDRELKKKLEAFLKTAKSEITDHGFTHPEGNKKYSNYCGYELQNPSALSTVLQHMRNTLSEFDSNPADNPYERLQQNMLALRINLEYRMAPAFLKKKKRIEGIKLFFRSLSLVVFAASTVAAVVFLFPMAFTIVSPALALLACFGLIALMTTGLASLSVIPFSINELAEDIKKFSTQFVLSDTISEKLHNLKINPLIDKAVECFNQYDTPKTQNAILKAIEANTKQKRELIEREIVETTEDIEKLETTLIADEETLKLEFGTLLSVLTVINNELAEQQHIGSRLTISPNDSACFQKAEQLLNNLLKTKTLNPTGNVALTQAVSTASELLKKYNLLPTLHRTCALLKQKREALNAELARLNNSDYETNKFKKYQQNGKQAPFEKNENRFASRLLKKDSRSNRRGDVIQIKGENYSIFTQHSRKVTTGLINLAKQNKQITDDFSEKRFQHSKRT